MTFDLDDTICAIASAPGGALRGIIRVSGPQTLKCVAQVLAADVKWKLTAAKVPSCQSATLDLGDNLGAIAARLYVWPTTRSYTRQPSAEVHLVGSPPILVAGLAAICGAGARLARPGEFTLRALLAGRLDLTQAEAVLGVIDAQSRAELDAALAQLAGGLARPLAALRSDLLDLLAHLEAGLDFTDEDIQFITPAHLAGELQRIVREIAEIENKMESRGDAGSLPRVVLVGEPNAGKSSLLNALTSHAAAIVSDIPGTTRDFVARRVSLGGQEVVLTDTAGVSLQLARGEIEALAQGMTRTQMKQADLTVLCLDASRPLSAWEQGELDSAPAKPRVIAWTKCDLMASNVSCGSLDTIWTSSVTGQGVDELRRAIVERVASVTSEAHVVAGTAERCRDSLRLAREALGAAIQIARSNGGEELVAGELRLALDELGRVVGAVYTDDVLDRIFSRFCIGK